MSQERRELLLGCGANKEKLMGMSGRSEWSGLVTVDINPDVNPDVIHDLNDIPLPFEDDSFDEIHAYEVLEHCGRQGDAKFFFAQFDDFYRILRPGGYIFATVPSVHYPHIVWGDPGHARCFTAETLMYLDRNNYQATEWTCMTDYRWMYRGDFELAQHHHVDDRFRFLLRTKKEPTP